MLPNQLVAGFKEMQAICPHKWFLDFLLGERIFEDFSSSPDLIWFAWII